MIADKTHHGPVEIVAASGAKDLPTATGPSSGGSAETEATITRIADMVLFALTFCGSLLLIAAFAVITPVIVFLSALLDLVAWRRDESGWTVQNAS